MVLKIRALSRLAILALALCFGGAVEGVSLFAQDSATIQARAYVVPRVLYQAEMTAANMAAPCGEANCPAVSYSGGVSTRQESSGGAVVRVSYPRPKHAAGSLPYGTGMGGLEGVLSPRTEVEILYIAN
jgi:hypothetical protein